MLARGMQVPIYQRIKTAESRGQTRHGYNAWHEEREPTPHSPLGRGTQIYIYTPSIIYQYDMCRSILSRTSQMVLILDHSVEKKHCRQLSNVIVAYINLKISIYCSLNLYNIQIILSNGWVGGFPELGGSGRFPRQSLVIPRMETVSDDPVLGEFVFVCLGTLI